MAATNGSGNKILLAIVAVIVLGGVAALGYSFSGGGNGADQPVDMADLAGDPQALFERAVAVKMGPDDAPVKVVEFADFQCPACGSFALQAKPMLDQRFMDTGLVQFIFYDFPLMEIHQNAFLAARAARCAGDQDMFWAYHDRLFQNQTQWSPASDPSGRFSEYMEQVGGDVREFEQCLESDRHADVVTANRMMGEQLRVNSTPTIIVNSRRITGSTMNELTTRLMAAIQDELDAVRSGDATDAASDR